MFFLAATLVGWIGDFVYRKKNTCNKKKDVYHVNENNVECILRLHLVNVTWPCVIMTNGHVTVYHYNDTRSTVARWSFDNDQRHVTAFRPIRDAAHSWSHDKIGWRLKKNWRKFSVAVFIFTYFQQYFSGPLTYGVDRPHRSATAIDPRQIGVSVFERKVGGGMFCSENRSGMGILDFTV